MNIVIKILSLVPKNLISACTGLFAEAKLPRFLLAPIINAYVSFYKVDLSEVKNSLEDFNSLSDFFVRDLKDGCRPLDSDFCSPADGSLVVMEDFSADSLIQAKGSSYSLVDFLVSEDLAQSYINGICANIYLSPKDYHNVHMPISASIKKAVLVPGALWPVNNWSVRNIPSLFAINERIILECEAENGEFVLVLVGATNVGSIRLEFSSMRGNASLTDRSKRSKIEVEQYDDLTLEKGAKLGSFYLGSTVILLFKEKCFTPLITTLPMPLKYGSKIGEFSSSGLKT